MCGHSLRNGRAGFSFLVYTISKNGPEGVSCSVYFPLFLVEGRGRVFSCCVLLPEVLSLLEQCQ
jgi:hypothetical protein